MYDAGGGWFSGGAESPNHIRVVRFEEGETRITGNDIYIYDLRRKTVNVVPVNGDGREEPFKEVLLVARRLRKKE